MALRRRKKDQHASTTKVEEPRETKQPEQELPQEISPLHMWFLAFLTFISFILRAWRLDFPKTPVYDESYMGVVTNSYGSGTFFFDIHPPFSRLLHFYLARMLNAPYCHYTKQMTAVTCDMWQMRAAVCICGTLLVPVTFKLCRLLKLSPSGALFAASLVAFDNMFFSLSRIHLLDMVTVLCMACTATSHAQVLTTLTSGMSSSWVLWAMVDGTFLGCAISSKFGVCVPTALWCVAWTYSKAIAGHTSFIKATMATTVQAASSIVVYLGLLWWHFELIAWKNAEGDQSYAAYMLTSRRFSGQITRLDRVLEVFFLQIDFTHNSNGFVDKVLDFTLDQWYYYWSLDSYSLEVARPPNSHHSHSIWSTWLYGYRGLLWSTKDRPDNDNLQLVYMLPNMVICWMSTAAVAAVGLLLLLKVTRWIFKKLSMTTSKQSTKEGQRVSSLTLGVLLLAWWMHLWPFTTVERETFIIYYVFSYYYALLILAAVLDRIMTRASPRTQTSLYLLIIILLVLPVFGYMMPFTVTGLLKGRALTERMGFMTPACWYDDCMNTVPEAPTHALLSLPGKNSFRTLLNQLG